MVSENIKTTCVFCGKRYFKKHLADHYHTHTNEKWYNCKLCSKAFANSSNLKKHSDRHFKAIYKCPTCQYCFKNPNLLSRHKKSRSGKVFQCERCCESFERRQDLIKHDNKRHSYVKESEHGMPNKLGKMRNSSRKPSEREETSSPSQFGPTLSGTVMGLKRNQTSRREDSKRLKPLLDIAYNEDSQIFHTNDIISNSELLSAEISTVPGSTFLLGPDLQVQTNESIDDKVITDKSTTEQNQVGNQNTGMESEHVVTTNEEDNTMFALKTWRITNSPDTLHKLHDEHNKVGAFCSPDPQDKILLSFLTGQDQEVSVDYFEELLSNNGPKPAGIFVEGLLVAFSASQFSYLKIMDLFQRVSKFENDTTKLIKFIAILALRNQIRKDYPCVINWSDIPNELRDSTASIMDYNVDFKCTFQVGSILHQMALKSASVFSSLLCDGTFPEIERVQCWTSLVFDFLRYLPKEKCPSFLQLILLRDINMHKGTVIYFYVGTSENPVHLHDMVVKKYSRLATPSSDILKDVTMADVGLLKSLLYEDYDVNKMVGKIATNVYRMIIQLQIHDIKKFLFRGNRPSQLTTKENEVDILQIMIKLEMDCEINLFASEIFPNFTEEKRVQLVTGLNPKELYYFLWRESIEIDEMDVYNMIIKWCFAKCRKPVNDMQAAMCDESLYEQFVRVRGNLRLLDLKRDFVFLLSQQFVKPEDVRCAETMLLCGASTWPNLKPWLAIGKRGT